MNGGPSGFHNAPVTRAVVIASALMTVAFGVRGRYLKLGLSYQNFYSAITEVACTARFGHLILKTVLLASLLCTINSEDIYKNFHLWKMITSTFAFSSTPELMFGLYLLYYFRVFERHLGSNKHCVFVLFSVVVSSLLEVLSLLVFKEYNVGSLSSGPYGLIFASFVPFYFDIPVSSRFHVFGLHFSDKSFIYLAGFQLLLSSWKRSLVPGICGLIAGALYRLNLFGIRRLKFPKVIASLFAQLSWPSSGSPTNRTSRSNVIRNVPPPTGRQVQGNYPAALRVAVSEPPESSIATLVSMGFDSSAARQALIQARNDVNAATNILLEAQSH